MAAIEGNLEDVRPVFNYVETQKKLRELERKIRTVKHAINLFNTTTMVDGFDMTIDEVLVYIPKLSYNREKHGIDLNGIRCRILQMPKAGEYISEQVFPMMRL